MLSNQKNPCLMSFEEMDAAEAELTSLSREELEAAVQDLQDPSVSEPAPAPVTTQSQLGKAVSSKRRLKRRGSFEKVLETVEQRGSEARLAPADRELLTRSIAKQKIPTRTAHRNTDLALAST